MAVSNGLVKVDHGLYLITDGYDVWPSAELVQNSNGLVDVHSPDCAVVATGTHTGTIRLQAVTYDSAPPVQAEDWTDVVEFSLDVGDNLVVRSLMDAAPIAWPSWRPQPTGWYRLRLYVRGRDEAATLWVADGLEVHLLEAWPSTRAEDPVTIKATDQHGASRRST